MGNAAVKTPVPEPALAQVIIKIVVDEQPDGQWSAHLETAALGSVTAPGATPEEAAAALMRTIHTVLEAVEDAEDLETAAARQGNPTEPWADVRKRLDRDAG